MLESFLVYQALEERKEDYKCSHVRSDHETCNLKYSSACLCWNTAPSVKEACIRMGRVRCKIRSLPCKVYLSALCLSAAKISAPLWF